MKNIHWFLKKYGNTSFDELEFNEIDALILSQVGYLNLELFSDDFNQEVFLKDVINEKNAKKLSYGSTTRPKNEKMCKLFEDTSRYDNIYFKYYRSILNNATTEQFFGVTFFIKDIAYIVFRGTDCSLTGWEEDLNMAFMNIIPSQSDALAYVNDVHRLYHRKLLIGGHSKGGNLALYAGMFANPEVQDDIIKIYDFDGPGFLDKTIFLTAGYRKIKDRVETVSASLSMVAMLLYNVENIEFLKTRGFTIFQHDPFNWFFASEHQMKRIKKKTISSRYFEASVDHFFEVTTAEERERFVRLFVGIAKEKPESSLLDFVHKPFSYTKRMIDRRKLLSTEDAVFYKKFCKLMLKSFGSQLKIQLKITKKTKKSEINLVN